MEQIIFQLNNFVFMQMLADITVVDSYAFRNTFSDTFQNN